MALLEMAVRAPDCSVVKAQVVIGEIDEEARAAVVQEIRDQDGGKAFNVRTDVTEPEQVEHPISQAIEAFGKMVVFFGNAGILPLGMAWETPLEDCQRCLDVNFGGSFLLAKFGVSALIEAGGGVMLFTASELGIVGISGAAAYCASKGGLVNITRAIAIDCAP